MSSPKFQDLSTGSKTLIIIEFIIFAGALIGSKFLYGFIKPTSEALLPGNILFIYTIIFALITQLSCLALGLYNSKIRESFRGILRRLFVAIAIGFSITTLGNSFDGDFSLASEVLIAASMLSFMIDGCFRYWTLQVDFFGFNKRKVLVIGTGERASIIEKRMRRDVDRQHFTVHGYVVMQGDSENGIERETKIELEGSLAQYAIEHEIDEIVVASDERRNNLPVDDLFACKIRGIEVSEILDFIERETGQIAVNLIYPSWVIYSNGFASTNYLRNTLDWLFNASLAFILTLLSWPVMLIAALCIKLEDGWRAPIFYAQERVGIDGEPFYIIKFRSMSINAEQNGAQWATKNDSRVTRVGEVIRKYRIDELPQMYNVVRGEMGFVGPRPERPQFVQDFVKKIPYYNERHNVKPGLSGWAQLKYPYGSTEEDAIEKLKYDLYYIKHRSFMLDLLILIRTVEIVVFGKGR